MLGCVAGYLQHFSVQAPIVGPQLIQGVFIVEGSHSGIVVYFCPLSALLQMTSHSPRVRVSFLRSGSLGRLCSHTATTRDDLSPRDCVSPLRRYLLKGDRMGA